MSVAISGDVTSSVRVPEAAEGKYIGVRYTPLSKTGLPLEGLAVEMWDLSNFYKQNAPTAPGLIGLQLNDDSLKTVQLGDNNYSGGSGGGKVRPKAERPEIRNLTVSGIMAPGQMLALDYDFVPYPDTKQDEIDNTNDKSLFFWGDLGTTLIRSDYFDETKSVDENSQLGTQFGRISQGMSITLTLNDIGSFVEVTALPMRKASKDTWPVTGKPKTYPLSQFADTIESLERPNVSSLVINGLPSIGQELTANYIYTPSNSLDSYDASKFRWSYSNAGSDVVIKEGFIATDPAAIPDYTQVVSSPGTGALTTEQLGGPVITPDFSGNIFKLRIDAIDKAGLTGNWAQDDTSVRRPGGTPNDMFGIKLVEYNYGGSFPVNRTYGKGYPSTGFAGATFRLFAESFDLTANEQNWTWDIVENSHYAVVDKTGKVTLTRIPPKDGVIRITATNKTNPSLVRSHSFTIDKWLLTFRELSNGSKGYSLSAAKDLCNNFTRSDVNQTALPTVPDYTSLPVDPQNPMQSKGAHVRSAGWNTIYTFPSSDFFSQWGELDVYREVNVSTGAYTNQWSFPEAGTPYAWTRDVESGIGKPIFAAPTGWADWFVWDNTNTSLNAACIVYADDFIPEIPVSADTYMAGIKLPYTGYPKNNTGFSTAHQKGRGFPSLGFNGARFLLFAQDGPGSAYFIGNNTTANNINWTWKINDGANATQSSPSKNPYAFVTYDGQVTLLAPPPKGYIIEVTAENGSQKRSHSFSLDKWLYSFRDLGQSINQTLPSAQAVCQANNLRLPTIAEYTAMPVDPNNAEQSLGFSKREQGGWSIIYTFPSNDYYSQWGEMNHFYRYDPVTLTQAEGNWYANDYWSESLSAGNHPITARISGWGDWLSFSGDASKTQKYFSCIDETHLYPPQIAQLNMFGHIQINFTLKANYVYTPGISQDPSDASQHRWIFGDNVESWTTVTQSGYVQSRKVTEQDLGKVITVEVQAKDKAGVAGNTLTASITPPTIKDLKLVSSSKNPSIVQPDDVLTGAYTFVPGSSGTGELESTYVWDNHSGDEIIWHVNEGELGVIDQGYKVTANDIGKTISLTVRPRDESENVGGNFTVDSSAVQAPPSISELKIFYYTDESIPLQVGRVLGGSYKFNPGTYDAVDGADKSIIQWEGKTAQAATIATLSGFIPEYRVKDDDVGSVISLTVTAKNALGIEGNTQTVSTATVLRSPKIDNLVISGVIAKSSQLTASYTYTPGTSADPSDESQHRWTFGDNAESWETVTQEGTAKSRNITEQDLGKVIKVEVQAKDKSGLVGNTQSAEFTPPTISNLSLYYTSGEMVKVGHRLGGTYVFNPGSGQGTDKSVSFWTTGSTSTTPKTAPGPLWVPAYIVQEADLGHVIKLTVTATDSLGSEGNTLEGETSMVSSEPAIKDLSIVGTITQGAAMTGTYTYTAGISANNTDASRYRWSIGGIAKADWGVVNESGKVPALTMVWADLGQTLKLEVQAKDKAGVVGNTLTASITPPSATNVVITTTSGTGYRPGSVLKGAYTFVKGSTNTDEKIAVSGSSYVWNLDANHPDVGWGQMPVSGSTGTYTIKDSDVGNVITLRVRPVDLAGHRGKDVIIESEYAVITASSPLVSDVKVVANFATSAKITGTYTFTAGKGSTGTDKSTYVWLVDSVESARTGTVTTAGKVDGTGAYTVTQSDVGKKIELKVTAKDSGGVVGNTAMSSNSATYVAPSISSISVTGPQTTQGLLTVSYAYNAAASNQTDKSVVTWVTTTSPNGVSSTAKYYTLQTNDLKSDNTVNFKVTVKPTDGNGITGEAVSFSDSIIITPVKPTSVSISFVRYSGTGNVAANNPVSGTVLPNVSSVFSYYSVWTLGGVPFGSGSGLYSNLGRSNNLTIYDTGKQLCVTVYTILKAVTSDDGLKTCVYVPTVEL